MRKTLIAVAAGFALIVAALLTVPAMVDWSRYRDVIEARIERATGREVAIAGDVGLRLLPTPAFTAERITVGNPPGFGDAPFATIAELAIRLRLLPLLTGDVAIESLVLKRPDVALARLPDGRDNWTFTAAAATAPTVPAQPSAQSAGGDEAGIRLGDLRITGGRVSFRDGDSRPVVADDVTARIEADSLSGPYRVGGGLTVAGTELLFEGALDRVGAERGSPARLAVSLPKADASLRFTGMFSRMSAGPALRGPITLTAADGRRLPGFGLPGAVTVEGDLALSGDQAALTDLVATLAGTRATGAVTVGFDEPTKIDARLSVSSLDLDRLLEAAPAPAAQTQARPSPAPSKEAGTSIAGPPVGPSLTLPAGMFADIELAVETVSYQGEVFQQARAHATLADGEVVIHGASAQGPGGTVAAVAGVLSTPHSQPAFDGQAELRSDNLRAALDWLKVDTSAVAADRLRHAEASATIRANGLQVELHNLDITVDGVTAKGTATARMTERPAFGLALSVGALNLDAYRRPDHPTATAAPAQPAQPSDPAQPAPPASSPSVRTDALGGFDADLRLSVGTLTANGIAAEGVRLSALLQDGTLTLREAAATIADSRASAQGRVVGLDKEPRAEPLTLALDSPLPARLFRFLGVAVPGGEAWGRLTASAKLTGDLAQLSVDARAATGGVEAAAAGTLADVLSQPRYRLDVRTGSATVAQFIRLFSPGYRPAGSPGAVMLTAKLAGGPQAVELSDLSATAGPARLTGQARIDLAGARPVLTADLAANALDVAPFLPTERTGLRLPLRAAPPAAAPSLAVLPAATGAGATPWSREALDLTALRAFDAAVTLKAESVRWSDWALAEPQARVTVRDGTAALDQLTGRLLGGALNASAKLTSAGTPQLSGQLSIKDAAVAQAKLGAGGIAVTQGRLNTEARFTTVGRSSFDMAQGLKGDGSLLVSDGVLSGFDLPAVNARLQNIENLGSVLGLVQSGLQGGQTRFAKLAGTFTAENGVITSRDLRLDAEGGTATGEALIRLPPWTLQAAIAFQLAGSQAPAAVVRLEGPIDNPRKVIDINALQAHLATRGLGRALNLNKPKAETGQPPQPEEKPEKVLRNLLKGLVR